MGFKYGEMELEKQIALPFIAMAACVLILTVLTIWFSNSGVKPEETAISASVEFKGYILPNGRIRNSIVINTSDKKVSIKEFRELEEQVKNATLKTYTDLIVWDATFTYKQKDGTEETYAYTKTGANKAVDSFLKKYYEDFDKDVNME